MIPYYPMLFATLWSNVICDPRDAFYHRYPEMGGALCYWLRAYPSVKGLRPSLNQIFFENSLFFVFYKNVFATHHQKILEFLFFFVHPFLYLLFLKMWRECYPKVFHPKVFDKGGEAPKCKMHAGIVLSIKSRSFG